MNRKIASEIIESMRLFLFLEQNEEYVRKMGNIDNN